MTTADWAKITHFRPEEFDSPDKPGSGFLQMDKAIVGPLEYIREQCGFPLIVTSGFRTKEHNATLSDSVGDSSHLSGLAADIACRTSQQRYKIIHYAYEIGLHRMGIGKTFIHLDASPFLPPDVSWLY